MGIRKKLFLPLCCVALLLTSSCGYFSDDPVENSDLYSDTTSLSGQCELKPNEFGKIFERDITAQIKCVRDNFIQFSRYVRTSDADSIGEGELQHFVSKFFAKNSDTIIKGLQVLFEVNMLLLRDHSDRLSRGNIDPLYELLLSINKQGVQLTQVLKKMTEDDRHLFFQVERKRFKNSLEELSEKMLEVINQRSGLPQELNIKDFVLSLNDSFNVGDDRFDEELVDSLIFLKRIFLGGKRETITSDEMKDMVRLVPNLVMEAFDLIFSSPKMFDTQAEQYSFYQTKIVNIAGLLYPLQDERVLFDEDDIYRIYEAIIGDEEALDLNEYRVIIQSVKRDLIGGHPKNYNFKDLQKSLLLVNLGLEGLNYFNESKDLLKDLKVFKSEDINVTKKLFLRRTSLFQDGIQLRINELPHLPTEVRILDFFKTLNQEIEGMNYDIELIESLFAIKTLSVGGRKDLLTEKEFFQATEKLGSYAELFFDFRYQLATIPEGEERTLFLSQQLEKIEGLLANLDNNRVILTQKDVYALMKAIEEDQQKREELKKVYRSFKRNVLSTDEQTVSFKEFKKTLGFAKILNKSGSFFNKQKSLLEQIDQAENRGEYEFAKTLYIHHLDSFLKEAKRILVKDGLIDPKQEVYFFNFLTDLATSLGSINLDPDMLKEILPLKQILLGGKREQINQTEIFNLFDKIPQLADIGLDVYKYGLFDQTAEFFVLASKTLSELITKKTIDGQQISISDLINISKRFSTLPLEKFKPTFNKLKTKLLGGNADEVTVKNLHDSAELLRDFSEQFYFNQVTYQAMKSYLETIEGPLQSIPRLNLRAYNILQKKNLSKYRKLFSSSLKKHRYYAEEDSGLQRWGHPYKRTEFGFLQLKTIKWLVIELINAWGHQQSDLPHGHAISVDEMETALNDFKPLLEEYGLWTAYPETFARNTVLLGDLFQNSSNGDMNLDVDELAEYGTMVLSAIQVSNDFIEKLIRYCEPVGGTDLSNYSFNDYCYREYVFPILFDELKYQRYFPMLSKFYEDSIRDVSDAPLNYLTNLEGFVRDTTTNEMPRREFTLIFGAMINIETTFIRFDTNKNNQLDPEELDGAFEVYKNAIIAVADLSDSQRKYAKSIFLYMLKEMRIPSTWELMRFHYSWFNKDIVARRVNVGALLYYLVRQ